MPKCLGSHDRTFKRSHKRLKSIELLHHGDPLYSKHVKLQFGLPNPCGGTLICPLLATTTHQNFPVSITFQCHFGSAFEPIRGGRTISRTTKVTITNASEDRSTGSSAISIEIFVGVPACDSTNPPNACVIHTSLRRLERNCCRYGG